jgi:hypothetical protein
MLGILLVVILVVLLIGVVPSWPHSANRGFAPSGLLGLVLVVVIILILLGRF